MIELNYSPEEIAELANIKGFKEVWLKALCSEDFIKSNAKDYFIALIDSLPGDSQKNWQIVFMINCHSLNLESFPQQGKRI